MCPAALFTNDRRELLELAKNQCAVTHAHEEAQHCAALMALAINLCMHWMGDWVPERFVGELLAEASSWDGSSVDGSSVATICSKLEEIGWILKTTAGAELVAGKIGTGVRAIEAVPAAIYLAARHMLAGFEEIMLEARWPYLYYPVSHSA